MVEVLVEIFFLEAFHEFMVMCVNSFQWRAS
jgi:hypothetical protein